MSPKIRADGNNCQQIFGHLSRSLSFYRLHFCRDGWMNPTQRIVYSNDRMNREKEAKSERERVTDSMVQGDVERTRTDATKDEMVDLMSCWSWECKQTERESPKWPGHSPALCAGHFLLQVTVGGCFIDLISSSLSVFLWSKLLIRRLDTSGHQRTHPPSASCLFSCCYFHHRSRLDSSVFSFAIPQVLIFLILPLNFSLLKRGLFMSLYLVYLLHPSTEMFPTFQSTVSECTLLILVATNTHPTIRYKWKRAVLIVIVLPWSWDHVVCLRVFQAFIARK